MRAVPKQLTNLSGKAAVFVRGMIQYIDAQDANIDIPLRKAQEAGLAIVEELGETISVPYISKLSKMLETLGVVNKSRKGKKYVVNKDLLFDDFAEWLMDNDFGTEIQAGPSDDDIRMRSAMLDHMTDIGSVRIEAEHPLNKVAYQVLIEKFKSGAYDMVFVARDLVLRMEEDDELGYPVETLRSSVSIQK